MYLVKCPLTDREIRAEWVMYAPDGNVWYKELVGGCTVKCSVEPKITFVREELVMTDELKMIEFNNAVVKSIQGL